MFRACSFATAQGFAVVMSELNTISYFEAWKKRNTLLTTVVHFFVYVLFGHNRLNYHLVSFDIASVILYDNVSQSVLQGTKRTYDQFPWEPWILFCHVCLEVYLFFN